MKVLVIASELDVPGESPDRWPLERAGDALTAAATACERGLPQEARACFHSAAARLAQAASQEGAAYEALLARALKEHHSVAAREMLRLARDVLVYDGYFGIRRVTRSTATEQARAAAAVLGDMASCLPEAPLTFEAKAALARLAADTLGERATVLAHAPASGGDTTGGVPAFGGAMVAAVDVTERWKLGHLVYGLANRAAARKVEHAAGELVGGGAEAARELLSAATDDIEAASAAMELAAALSAAQYRSEVRPTMQPPQLGVPLSGAMNADHRSLRQALSRLIAVLGQPFGDLAACDPELAEARDHLLHADLSDLERHIVLTLRLVGSRPALDEGGGQSAVQTLRALYLKRLRRYAAMLWRGDTVQI